MAKSSTNRVRRSNARSTTSDPRTNGPPAPYSTPPAILTPFLGTLNPQHVYIIHIDGHPASLKKRIFIVPILMNLAIAIFLAWRAVVAFPYYCAILLAMLGFDNGINVDISQTSWSVLLNIVFKRALIFLVDFSLVTFVGPWPLVFFVGSPASPCSWRWKVGFQEKEVVVRRSRRWDESLPTDWLAEEADGIIYQERIMPAIDQRWVRTKTGYLMIDRSWDLDYVGMMKAHEMVEQGRASLSDFEKTVIVHSPEHGWIIWPVYKLDEGSEEEGIHKVILFRDKLVAMGKEHVFFRWIELIQFETSRPEGFTPERQEYTMKEAKQLFESEGIDFDQFWEEVGGVQGLPGMEKAQ